VLNRAVLPRIPTPLWSGELMKLLLLVITVESVVLPDDVLVVFKFADILAKTLLVVLLLLLFVLLPNETTLERAPPKKFSKLMFKIVEAKAL
jgi:hypothetical protein